MSQNKRRLEHGVMLWLLGSLLLLLVLLLTSCATSPSTHTPALRPAVPPLSLQAQQEPLPAWCSQTCSEGWAGMLLQAALLRSVHLPWMPAVVVPLWLGVGAMVSWFAGRALLVRGSLR